MVTRLRVAFFGTPAFAVPTLRQLLASSHEVCGVVTQPDRPRGRGQRVTDAPVKALAVERGLPVLQPDRLKEPTVAEAISQWRPDLGVVAAYGRILPSSLLDVPRLGMINVHASLLPRYRGAAPVHRAVMAGDAETGVTIMRVVPELDAGAMLASVTRPIGVDDTADVVEHDLAEHGAVLLVRIVDALAAGPVAERPQDSSEATYAPRLTKAEGLIDWTLPARQIHDRVRGLYPWPHAYSYLAGERLIVLASRVDDAAADAPPGAIIEGSQDAIHIAAGGRTRLVITRLQPEGRRAMEAREFLAGHAIPAGSRFGVE